MSNGNGGVYLRKLQYEIPYSKSSLPQNRYAAQDLMISATEAQQDTGANTLRAAAAAESTLFSRYGVALKQYVDFITGYPEYLKGYPK